MNHSEKIYGPEKRFTDDIGAAIAEELHPGSGGRDSARLVRCDRDYWSVILVYEITGEEPEGNDCRIYCKIPKANWHITTVSGILTDDFESSKQMAESEFSSLNHLHADFESCTDSTLRVINPVGFIPEYNALLTEGVDNSTEVFEFLRPWGNQNRIIGEALEYLRKIGKWLGYFHTTGRQNGPNGFERQGTFHDQMRRMRVMAEDINRESLSRKLITYIDELSNKAPFDSAPPATLTIEGFEIRNFITDGKAVFFLDPGSIRSGSAYEDLARLIASLAILYWGQIYFLSDYLNEDAFLHTFIESYENENGPVDRETLNLYLAKQFIKLWIDGIQVLQHKRYLRPLDSIVQKLYIERFFSKRLDNILSFM